MIKLIFYGLVVYLIYKLVFEFVIPVSKASKQMREKLQQMQEQQRFQQEQARAQAQAKAEPVASSKPAASDKDYIEFEEVKP
jgi:sortase (surface protein transpeptidase)